MELCKGELHHACSSNLRDRRLFVYKEWGAIAGPNNVGNSKATSHRNRRLLDDLLVCEGCSWGYDRWT